MKVNWIEITNIKSYSSTERIYLNKDYNFIVGPNGSGKTTALQALASSLMTLIPRVKTTSAADNGETKAKFSIQTEMPRTQFQPNYKNKQAPQSIQLEVSFEDSFKGLVDEIKQYRKLFGENIEDLKANFRGHDGILDTIDSLIANLEPYKDFVFLFDFEVTQFNIALKPESREDKIALVDALRQIDTFRTIYEYLLKKGLVSELIDRGFNLIYLGADRVIGFSGQVGLSKGGFDEMFNNSSRSQEANLSTYIFSNSFDYISQSLLKIIEQVSNKIWRKHMTQADAESSTPELVQVRDALKDILGYELRISEPYTQFDNFMFMFFDGEVEVNFEGLSSGEKSLIYYIFTLANPEVKNSFIIVDEAELHLHGNMQDKILDMIFTEEALNNQHFISTHSPKMINTLTISSVLRFYKDNGQTKYVNFKTDADVGTDYDIIRLVNSQNNEKIFFADKVVLVEGIKDRILLNNLFAGVNTTKQIVEIIEVGGKRNFELYKKYLEAIKVPVYIFADLDHLFDLKKSELSSLLVTNETKVDEIIKDKNSSDRKSLVSALQAYLKDKDQKKVEAIIDYIKNRGTSLKKGLTTDETALVEKEVATLKKDKVYFPSKGLLSGEEVYSGEIEDFLKHIPQGKSSSEAIEHLVKYIARKDLLKDMRENCNKELFDELVSFILNVLHGNDDNLDEVIANFK